MKTELTDGTILLRPYREEDAPRLFAAVRESMVEMSPWLSWCQKSYSLENSTQFVQSRQNEWDNDNHYSMAIFGQVTDELLGGVGINFVNRIHQLANLGYWVRSSQAGHGIATRAARLMARFGFQELKLQRIEIIVATRNMGSLRVAEKVGAKQEGVLRNRLILPNGIHQAVMYSLVPEDLKNSGA